MFLFYFLNLGSVCLCRVCSVSSVVIDERTYVSNVIVNLWEFVLQSVIGRNHPGFNGLERCTQKLLKRSIKDRFGMN